MRAPMGLGSRSANPPLPPLQEQKNKSALSRREKRSTAVQAAALQKTTRSRETLPRRVRDATAPRFRARSASNKPLHRTQQFIRSERFGNVAICALLFAPVAIAGRRLGSHQDHRNL